MKIKFNSRRKAMVEVVATVVGMNEHLSSGGSHPSRIMVYQPTFEYDWKGFKRTLQVDVWSSKFNFEIGDKVTLLIDPDDASNYRFKDFDRDPRSLIIFVFVVMISVVIAAYRGGGNGNGGAGTYRNAAELYEAGTVANVYYREDYRTDLIKTIDGNYSRFKIQNERDAIRSFEQIKTLIGMKEPAEELVFVQKTQGPAAGSVIYHFDQYYKGIPVYGGSVKLAVRNDGYPYWFTGNFVPEIELDTTEPAIGTQEMRALIERMGVQKVYDDMSLCVFENEKTEHRPTLAYCVTVDAMESIWNNPDKKMLLDFTYIVNADTGELLFSNQLTIVD